MHWLKVVYYIVLTLALIACIRGYKQRQYILFIPLLALALGVEVLRDILPGRHPLESILILLYVMAEYALLSWIISNFIFSTKKKSIIRYSIFFMLPLLLIAYFLIDGNSEFYYILLIETPFLCIWTILYLFENARQNEEFQLATNPMFWISLGNLLFYSGSFFSYGFGSYLMSQQSNHLAYTIFWVAKILNILLYILYTIGFLCLRRIR